MAATNYALSIRQPWATLLAHGLKTIEVRSWSTARRGRVFIHASRVADPRPEAWSLLPADLRQSARARGGLVAEADLCNCLLYPSQHAFAADQRYHLNDPSWFRSPRLFGFVFRDVNPLPFRACPGYVRFFQVSEGTAS